MTNCISCDSELIIHKGKYNTYGYCKNCNDEKYVAREKDKCCFNPSFTIVKMVGYAENIRVVKQCGNCGYSNGYGIKKGDYDLDKLEFKDETKAEEFFKLQHREYLEIRKIFKEYKKENKQISKKTPGYKEYLKSPLWQEKRELVLKRDNYLCQACLTDAAVQVHHLSYKHVFNEPLFELISVCLRCHDIITNMDRKNETEKIKH